MHVAPPMREEELRGSASRPVLEGYALDRVVAESTVGVVYLATDLALKLPVAVKEYLPQRLARRHSASLVVPLPGEAPRFERGLRAFVDESRTLARCEHPSLLRVLRLIEGHGTAYRVMPHHAGQRLDEMRRRRGVPPDGVALRRLLEGLLDALQAWQLVGGVHGRIVPDNILLLLDGRPLLMGPGAVEAALAPERRGMGGATSSDGWPVGPWIDVDAVARVGRFCITGEWPEEGTEAAAEPLRDAMQRLGLAGPRLPIDPALVDAIAAATSPEPHLRPQSVAQLREWLTQGPPAALAVVDVPVDVALEAWADAAFGAEAAPAEAVFGAPPEADLAPLVAGGARASNAGAVYAGSPFEFAPDEIVIATDVGPAGIPTRGDTSLDEAGDDTVPGALRPTDADAAGMLAWGAPRGAAPPAPLGRAGTPKATGPSAAAPTASGSPPAPASARSRPPPQLTPELASLAGRLAAQRQALPVEDADRGGDATLPGARRRSADGLSRRSGLPTWAFALIGLAVVVALGVVLLADQQPVRVEGWTPQAAVAPAARDARPALAPAPVATPSVAAPTTSTLASRGPTTSVPAHVPVPPGETSRVTTSPTPLDAVAVAAPSTAAMPPVAAPPLAATSEVARALFPSVVAAAPQAAVSPPAPEARVLLPGARAPAAPSPSGRPQPLERAATPSKAARPAPIVASPREACGERTQFSLYRCMQTQCEQNRWYAHAQCVRFRKTDEVE